jgi:hypothetical protein
MKNIMIFLGISCLTGVTVAACSGDNSTTPATDGGGEASSGASTGASSGSGTSSGTSTGASTGAADAGVMVMCQNKSVCTTAGQICCVAFNGGISVACQAPPCPNIPTVGTLQLCATDAECYNAGDKCGMVMTPVMTVMACATPDGGAGDGGHSDAPASDAPASDAPASDAPASDAPASDAPTG